MKRRRSVKKQTFKVIVEGKKKRIHFTLTPEEKIKAKLEDKEKNPDKISFGKIGDGRLKIEFFTYRDMDKDRIFIALEDDIVVLDKFGARKLMSIAMKVGRWFGITWTIHKLRRYLKRGKKNEEINTNVEKSLA